MWFERHILRAFGETPIADSAMNDRLNPYRRGL